MWASSATNSSYSSSVSSSDPHLPYQHPQPTSTVSLPQARRAMPKYRRFYSSPMDEGDSTPIQLYGLERRPNSIIEKPKLLRRVSHALDDIKEDFAYQLADPSSTAAKLKRRSTFLLDGSLGTTSPRPETADCHGPSSRRMSVLSAAPQRGLSRRLSRRLSIFGGRKVGERPSTASISTPNLIGSSAMN
ncbi:uncharacterized protein N7484_007069 [Penicillium longicatenatum]|uniref:uncharacterized protein n=1 Tax=Penicillium longicatenatum TaxID=1561947 RepID=UPI002548F03D|nr:uncharacterized protein N7484_007069 [Penicillium longicatenatum]KAJ5639207.1 hypothetical protein N7484_007069 [Penicillium longicatenatum]